MGRVLTKIPYAEMWLHPADEGEMYYQLDVIFSLPVACVSFVICLLGCRSEVLMGRLDAFNSSLCVLGGIMIIECCTCI